MVLCEVTRQCHNQRARRVSSAVRRVTKLSHLSTTMSWPQAGEGAPVHTAGLWEGKQRSPWQRVFQHGTEQKLAIGASGRIEPGCETLARDVREARFLS
jgi:hypothetical protein